jgi:hypothetical protein
MEVRMRRLWLSLMVLVGLAVLGVAPANAVPPVRSGGDEVEVDLAFPAGVICDFPVDVHLEMKSISITFVDANGVPTRGISVGRIHAVETNALTGNSVFSSISGPSFFDASGALIMGTGTWSGIQLQDGTWIHASGLITFDADVLVTAVRGHVEPLCDVLG